VTLGKGRVENFSVINFLRFTSQPRPAPIVLFRIFSSDPLVNLAFHHPIHVDTYNLGVNIFE
jgi:hypothetical protein